MNIIKNHMERMVRRLGLETLTTNGCLHSRGEGQPAVTAALRHKRQVTLAIRTKGQRLRGVVVAQ